VTAALLCEKLLREADGVPSAIRIVDQITIPELSPDVPSGVGFSLWVLIALRGENLGGVHKMQLTGRAPTGRITELGTFEVTFSATAVPGANVFVQATVAWREPGVYWFDVTLDGEYVTSIPLEVLVAQQLPQSPSG
jgi:hypothetical protein